MLQEAAQELLAGECRCALRIVVSVILPLKGHMGLIDGDDSMVGYGNTMSVASQILKHVFRAAEGRLGVDDPVLFR